MVRRSSAHCVFCVELLLRVEAKKTILSCGDRTVVRTVFVSGIEEPLLSIDLGRNPDQNEQ
jgi:hypothetical protein